jgi:hypothetical protein
MSQEHVELIHRALDAFNRRDLDAVLAMVHGDVAWQEGRLAGCLLNQSRKPSKPWGCGSSQGSTTPASGSTGRPVAASATLRLPSGCGRAYRVRMTTAAKAVWIVIAVVLVLALLNALALALISPG